MPSRRQTPSRPTVGFDLDGTLIDTVPAISAVLHAAADALAVPVDVPAAMAALGPPMEVLLERQLDPQQARVVAAAYRKLYLIDGPRHAITMDGAREAVDAVRRQGGRAVVVTGQNELSARAHLVSARIQVDNVIGGLWGRAKRAALVENGVDIYVGDHPDDIAAAHGARAVAVAVTTGRHDAVELGASDVVLPSLRAFGGWLAQAIRAVGSTCDCVECEQESGGLPASGGSTLTAGA